MFKVGDRVVVQEMDGKFAGTVIDIKTSNDPWPYVVDLDVVDAETADDIFRAALYSQDELSREYDCPNDN